ncbi:hypothetical protein [Enterobacter hormaechei]|uniref:hypothetical protein n=1 Tax=Enterobacter hormaechei TaxID=158836 RepID=UPI000792059C|nr:hypothetical protein [Enterobacter hormaechei]MCU3015528.1 hypothetical protein [Enterobacter hormaechei subsp. oharae]MCU3611830.1 hypothetical protein [Enterobacter hormaechei subsp. oharae]CZV05170.1 Uncharacterised protein [Enterobacter hormaechei]CZV20774.1 Uncharacterised protein [Enterobacter hormaechei]CZV51356.1 Uncharacterised protein [Enterobacter hormaechei]
MLHDNVSIDSRIKGIWYQISSQNKHPSITLDEIKSLADERGLIVLELKEIKFGYDVHSDGILIKTNTGSAIFPRLRASEVNLSQERITPTMNYEKYWKHIDWFLPPYISNGALSESIRRCGVNPKNFSTIDTKIAQNRFEHEFSSLYPLSVIIPVTIQNLSQSTAISKHRPIIKEAILAFYSGMKIAAIAALIPIIEDILRVIVGEEGSELDTVSKINSCFDLARLNILKLDIHGVDWIPNEFSDPAYLKVNNERVFMLETLRAWLINSFYANTSTYNKESGFNRHHFAHALSDVWQNESNFFRAIGLIHALAFLECFSLVESRIRISVPESNDESQSFHAEVLACLQAQVIKKFALNRFQLTHELPFNATASDDGWSIRAITLSEKMDKIIIPLLRDKGWQCHIIGDPIKDGEYITVEAEKNGRNLKIALVYSFAISSEIYSRFSGSYDFVLCQGASYMSNEFTSHLQCQALPLSAWIAPDA